MKKIAKHFFALDEKDEIQSNPKWFTERERRVFELHYIDGKTIEEVAAIFEVNRSTIKRDLVSIRAKYRYRQSLKDV